jgi:hypothetical protein
MSAVDPTRRKLGSTMAPIWHPFCSYGHRHHRTRESAEASKDGD